MGLFFLSYYMYYCYWKGGQPIIPECLRIQNLIINVYFSGCHASGGYFDVDLSTSFHLACQ